MKPIGIHDAGTNFSRLLRRVAAGEEIIIARSKTPIARIVPVAPAGRRRLGIDAGTFTMPEDFNHPPAEDSLDSIVP